MGWGHGVRAWHGERWRLLSGTYRCAGSCTRWWPNWPSSTPTRCSPSKERRGQITVEISWMVFQHYRSQILDFIPGDQIIVQIVAIRWRCSRSPFGGDVFTWWISGSHDLLSHSDSGPLRLARTPSPPEDESSPESPEATSNHMLHPASPGPPRPKSPIQVDLMLNHFTVTA